MMDLTHSTIESTAEGSAAEVVTASGVGVGEGSEAGEPDCSGPPSACGVTVKTASRHSTASRETNFLTVVSPSVEVVDVDGRAPAVSAHSTPARVVTPSDKELFDSLLMSSRFREATELCRERLLSAQTQYDSFRWTKDRTIVMRAEGDYEGSLDLLASIHAFALTLGGAPRGRYENSLGRTLELLGRFDAAFERYTAGRFHHEQGGDLIACAQIDTNTGRCYVHAGRPDNSHGYFDRAANVARRLEDSHLLGEIEESRALAYEAVGDYAEALRRVANSVELLRPTGDVVALEETRVTALRIIGKVGR